MRQNTLISSRFSSFFISQAFVACGACIQLIAASQLVLHVTNSGLAAGLSMVGAPLPGIIFSLLAGSLGDRLNFKHLLVLFDLLRGALVFSFVFCKSVPVIFSVMMAVSLVDVLYGPSKNKALTVLLNKTELVRGNSLLNGGYGAVSLVVPTLAGVLVKIVGIETVFILGSGCYLLSAAVLGCVDMPVGCLGADGQRAVRQKTWQAISEGFAYCKSLTPVKNYMTTLAVLDFGTAAVNVVFYAFAFDTLHVTSAAWGLLLSVFYGMNVLSMALLLRFKKRLTRRPLMLSYMLIAAVAGVWCFYAFAGSYPFLLAGAAAEGMFSTLASTLLVTSILQAVHHGYTARVMSIRDLLSSVSKLAGILLTYLLLAVCPVNMVFVFAALAVGLFLLIRAVCGDRHTGYSSHQYDKVN